MTFWLKINVNGCLILKMNCNLFRVNKSIMSLIGKYDSFSSIEYYNNALMLDGMGNLFIFFS